MPLVPNVRFRADIITRVRRQIESGRAKTPAIPETWPAQPAPVFYDEAARLTGSPESILYDVATDHHVRIPDILGPGHGRDVTAARDEAAFRMCVELGMKTVDIGRILSRDHTSVSIALYRHAARVPGGEKALEATKHRRKSR